MEIVIFLFTVVNGSPILVNNKSYCSVIYPGDTHLVIVILRPASSSPEYLSQAEDIDSAVVAAEPRQIWGFYHGR